MGRNTGTGRAGLQQGILQAKREELLPHSAKAAVGREGALVRLVRPKFVIENLGGGVWAHGRDNGRSQLGLVESTQSCLHVDLG